MYKRQEQVILLVAGLNHVFQEIVPEQLDAFIPALLQHFGETQGALCNAIEDVYKRQYIFGEPFDQVQLISFGIIWIGLAFFSYGEFVNMKKKGRGQGSVKKTKRCCKAAVNHEGRLASPACRWYK